MCVCMFSQSFKFASDKKFHIHTYHISYIYTIITKYMVYSYVYLDNLCNITASRAQKQSVLSIAATSISLHDTSKVLKRHHKDCSEQRIRAKQCKWPCRKPFLMFIYQISNQSRNTK